jgi:Transglutaminase-like superfamily
MSRVERRSLAPSERLRLIAEALTAYAHARWSLLRHDLPTAVSCIRARARRLASRPAPISDDPQRLVLAAVRVIERLPADSRCLMRSLVVLGLLQRRGVETSLVIGVGVDPGFAAHAWVEREGVALLPAGGFVAGRLTSL